MLFFIIVHCSPKDIVSALTPVIVSSEEAIVSTSSSIANLPSRIAAAISPPARAPKVFIARPVASAPGPSSWIFAIVCSRPSRASIPSFANPAIAILRDPITSSVLTPSFSHFPRSAADSSIEKLRDRRGAPKLTIREDSLSTLGPVAWEALKTLSRASD